jgi:transposase
MLDEFVFPPELQVGVQQVESTGNGITIGLCSMKKSAGCPGCGKESDRIHSIYRRFPKDLPLAGHTVRLCVRVRRFFCDNAACEHRTFAEQFPGLLAVKAQRTQRLIARQRAIALALGGEAGRHLCGVLGMPLGEASLIRAIRGSPEVDVPTPRVLGIDDWAKRKGQTYGTILVDLEAHQLVEMLDSREAEAVTAWLKAHPGVEVVSRDRGGEYIKGISDGAPTAEQVADRWHLLSNLREALVALLEKKPGALKAAAQVAAVEVSASVEQAPSPENKALACGTRAVPQATVETTPDKVEQAKAARQAQRQACFEQVHAVYEATGSMRAVARQLHMSRRAVHRYLKAERCPQYPAGRVRHSLLTPYLERLEQRWQAGCTNASQLWRGLRQEGFPGSRGLVARWAARQRQGLPATLRYRRQQAAGFQTPLQPAPLVVPWSAKRAAWLIVKKPPDLDDDEKAALQRMMQADPQVALAVDLARQFITMVRHRKAERLDSWLETVKTSGLPALISFANGLQKDLTAVHNALRYGWSNGQTEGQVNRLKFLKRSMYGRANFDLLRKRVLARRGPPG